MEVRHESCQEFEPTAEMTVWIESLIDGNITAEQHAALEIFLMEDIAARCYFLDELQFHAALKYDACLGLFGNLPEVVSINTDSSRDLLSPPLNFLPTAYHGTVNFFSQEVPFSILMATLFMIVGGLIGSVMTVEHYSQMPGQSQYFSSDPFASNASSDKTIKTETEAQWVGRITGMVDVKWSDDKDYLPPTDSHVALGRKYMLDSGLMEITYYTGARVILQGPCNYQVESPAGGYLSLGKLTARVEKRGERKEERGEKKAEGGRGKGEETLTTSHWPLTTSSSHQPLAPSPSASSQPPAPSPLFAVRTPTAVVTDLGTEFGVEVEKFGGSRITVFAGEVVAAVVGAPGKPPVRERLRQGEAVRISQDLLEIARVDFAPRVFHRSLETYRPNDFDPATPLTLIPTADVRPAQWQYTLRQPDDDWMQPTFDSSTWIPGKAGFGAGRYSPETTVMGTRWDSSEIWLRKTIFVPEPIEFRSAVLKIHHDEDVEVYVNGRMIFREPGYRQTYAVFDVTEALKEILQPGANVVAVHTRQTKCDQYIDLGIELNPKGGIPDPTPLPHGQRGRYEIPNPSNHSAEPGKEVLLKTENSL